MDTGNKYVTTFEGRSFVWRLLTVAEYTSFARKRAAGIWSQLEFYDRVFDVVYEGDARCLSMDLPAGFTYSIGLLAMWLSGDCAGETEKEDLIAARQQYASGSFFEYMRRVILLAFPAYKPGELDQFDRIELFNQFVLAEDLLAQRTHMQGFNTVQSGLAPVGYKPISEKDILSPADIAKKQAKAKKIDFARENAELANEGVGQAHILDRTLDQVGAIQQREKRLSARQARALDRRT